MKKRITIPAIVVMIIIIILILFKCSGKNGQTPEPTQRMNQETSSSVANDTSALTRQAEKEAEYAAKEAQRKAEIARKEAQDLIQGSLESLQRFINSLKPQPQVFYVSPVDTTTINGVKGIKILVDPGVLETSDGCGPTDSIRVELLEILDQQDMILHNLQTMSGDSMLISDGMFRLEMFSGNERLRIKEGSGLNIGFPQNSRERMSLFFGVTDETGSPDWKLDTAGSAAVFVGGVPVYQAAYKAIPRSEVDNGSQNNYNTRVRNSRPGESVFQLLRRQIFISRLGWLNIDKFLSPDMPRADLTIRYQGDSVKAVKCYIIFKDLNGLVTKVFYPTPINNTFKGLPARQNIRIIAIGYRGTIPYFSDKKLYSNRKLTNELIFERTTEQELIEMVNNFE